MRNERAINIFGSKVANAHRYPAPLYPIVCEQTGADWLPFRPLYVAPTSKRFLEGAARTCSEAIWTNDAQA